MMMMNGRRGHYEALLDRDELRKQQLQNQLVTKSWWILTALAVVTIVVCVGPSSHQPHQRQQQDKHTLPTLLSVVHHETREYVVALNNPVYERLKRASFVPYDQITSHRNHLHQNAAAELPTLDVDRSQIGVRDPLTLSWIEGKDVQGKALLKDDDLIALYCGDEEALDLDTLNPTKFLEAATIAQARATSQWHNGNADNMQQQWHIPSFPVLRQELCQFALYQALPDSHNGSPQYTLLDTTDLIQIELGRTMPTGIHLALGNNPNEMVIQFTSGESPGRVKDQDGTPVARYNKQGSSDASLKASGTSHTYTANDMCEAPANITEAGKFQPPGMIHVIRLTDLEPNTVYSYKVGLSHGQGITWSDEYSFISPPAPGDSAPHSYLVYGDQGCPANGWGDGGKYVSAMTAREVLNPPDKNLPIRSVHHFGDLSYAIGAAHIWDEWLHMISPFTTKVPLMIAVGNHEYDHLTGGANGKDPSGVLVDDGYRPVWGNFANDSGGECGVPTSKYFSMPNRTDSNSNGVFWYSYDFANVHTTVLSSEHDLEPGSVQYQWLEADLRSVNRTLTPWLILELHRPLYESQAIWDNNDVGIARRQELEDLLVDYKVDLVLGGHYHAYLRTCDGLYHSKCNNGGPMHITIGSGGAAFLDLDLYSNGWTDKFLKKEFGYGRVTVANASALHFEFVKAGDTNDTTAGEVHDDVWILRER